MSEPQGTPSNAEYDARWLHEAYAAVPEIGEGSRWYDLLYRPVWAILRSRISNWLPRPARRSLLAVIDYLLPFAEHRRHQAWSREDPQCNLFVHPNERVMRPDIWVVEFFPPSEFRRLRRTLARQGWDRERNRYRFGHANQDWLHRARGERGRSWWRLGTVIGRDSEAHDPDARRGRLPRTFGSVDLVGLTVEPSLTVVVAHVRLNAAGRAAIDRVWHKRHEPRLVWLRRSRPTAQDRLWAAYARTQEARRHQHELAREWLRENCPGLFATSAVQHPIVDLLLLSGLDPTKPTARTQADRDTLRALGIRDASCRLSSTHLPGLLLEQVDETLHRDLPGHATWTLWGQLARVAEGARDEGYGDDDARAAGLRLDESVRDISVLLALDELMRLRRRQNADARDNARARHRRFRRSDALRLRDDFLRTSLDTTSVVRDIKAYAEEPHRRRTTLRRTLHPDLVARGSDPAGTPQEADADLAQRLIEDAEELAAFDADYRAIMGTAATLGMSATALVTQRLAIFVGLLSLTVAVVALLLR